jgi:PST family polysaccharide transporter
MSAANQSIAARVRRGLVVTGGSDAVRQAVEFATGIVLARLLMPEDFGVVAVVGSILQLSFVVANFGMGTAVIQAAEIDIADRHTAFTLSSLVGLILMLAVWGAAPWATGFFAMPSLAVFIPLMSTQLFVSGMSAIPVALLRRELAFKKVVVIEMGSSFIYAIVGVTLALTGFGIWSLVWAPIVSRSGASWRPSSSPATALRSRSRNPLSTNSSRSAAGSP